MSRIFCRKKLLIVPIAAAAAVGLGSGAYAYFTNAGSGSGTAVVGTSQTIEVSGSPTGTLYPGGADVPVAVSVHNPGSGAQLVGTISGSVADNGGCKGSWFVVDPIAFDTTVARGATVSAGSTNLRMTDSGTNQDACKGLTVTIDWASS